MARRRELETRARAGMVVRDTLPRIYALNPLLVGALDAWPAQFARVASLGFDTVGLPPVFRTTDGDDLFRVADHDRAHALFGASLDADEALRRLAALAAKEGLALHLDVDLGIATAAGMLAASNPSAFTSPGDADARDPRRPPAERDIVRARWNAPDAAELLTAWWADRLRRWADAGIAGLRCLSPAAVPSPIWRRLDPRLRRFAWLPGTSREKLAGLRDAGFAGVFDSLAWWDCRAGWYPEELAVIGAVAPVIATVEAPFGTRLADRFDRRLVAAAARRRLAVAALGSGMLVPMGFEYGARQRLDAAGDTPEAWLGLLADPAADIGDDIRAVNAMLAQRAAPASPPASLFGADAPALALFGAAAGELLVLNPDLEAAVTVDAATLLPATGGVARFRPRHSGVGPELSPDATLVLGPGETRLFDAVPAAPILAAAMPHGEATAAPRVAIEAVAPTIDAGRFAVKRLVGEVVEVTADLVCDGHDRLAAMLRWRAADATAWREVPMRPLGNDRWAAAFPLERLGRHVFAVEAWVDAFASYRHGLDAKVAAGLDVALEIEEGRRLVAGTGAAVADLAARLAAADDAACLALLRDPDTVARMHAADPRPQRATSAACTVDADRSAARFASWYELFPRSQSGDPARHGTFDDVIRHLPRVRAMGFDVLYFPPIHPIGRAFRKGPNNSLTPGPDDPGSPYAIGSEAGGHDAIHPELGTLDDFRRLRDAAAAHGLELALDFAVQCSPDHPWLREHRGWFDWRPDGSIRYAENPPKKYQDIVNVDFHAADAIPDLWLALRDVVLFWAKEGVRLFRVDNPHTKPLPFWEWLIADIRATDPGVVFLAEAFTRPKVMYRLAKLGFGQSYTYFTWRNEKREIMDYLTELTTTAPRDFFRPHFFVNTPDINPVFLQGSGRPGHLIRAALACTLSGLWGMYQGFELCDARPLPGREEYIDSEKYQIRVWPDRAPGDIVDEITRLNSIRRANPALHDHLGVAFHPADNDRVLFYRKRSADGTNVLLVAVNLDPHAVQEAAVELPLWEWGLPDAGALDAEDLMTGARFTWNGKTQRLRLDPGALPFAIWRVRPPGPFRPHLPPVAAAPAPTGHG